MAKVNKKENEEKNKFSQINSNTINNKKNIVFLTTRVNVYTSKTYTNNKNSNYTTQKPKEENRKILVNTNARPNTNFYHQNQNKMNIQSNQPSQYNISNYNKEAKEGENILTKNELDKDNKNLQEVKDDQHNIQEEKPKYINKLPLTVNINLNTQKIDDKDSKIIPISKEKASTENVNNINKKIIEQGNYVNKMNNYNIQPSSNIKNPVAQTKVITTNTNINKPIITNRGITNRNGNKYQHSNLNNVITTSSRPVTTRNYQTNTPNNIKKVISSNRPTGIKTENIEKKILVEKYLKPETKSTNTLDTKNQISRGLNNQNNQIKVSNNNIQVTGNSLGKSSYISQTTHPSIQRTDIKINVNINNNIPINNRTNIKIGEKPNYRCITYSRPSKNTTNVTHYINRISTNSSNGDNNTNLPQKETTTTTTRTNNIQARNLSKVSKSKQETK